MHTAFATDHRAHPVLGSTRMRPAARLARACPRRPAPTAGQRWMPQAGRPAHATRTGGWGRRGGAAGGELMQTRGALLQRREALGKRRLTIEHCGPRQLHLSRLGRVLPQRWEALWSGGFLAMLPCEHGVRAADDGPGDLLPSKGGVYMGYCKWRGWFVLCAMMALPALSM